MRAGDGHGEAPGRLAVLDELRTRRGAPTRAALRHRAILLALASGGGPAERTRTGVARRAARGGTRWNSAYASVVRSIDGVLIPLGLVEEAGRIPPQRGPGTLHENGIPYYHLTRAGALVAAAFAPDAGVAALLAQALGASGGEEARVGRALGTLAGFAPGLAREVLEGHVREFCEGRERRLLPLTAEKLAAGAGDGARASARFLAGALELGEEDRAHVGALLGAVSGGGPAR
ncbi:MAG: hypothetical protein OXU37_07885 [Thaumarchaeota archaeon]|nr:hypothetical protein [Nitrososphaerota archaeon]MDD9842619.1 hypothetical protein [Nitrososphaerota archaeon]